MKGSVKCKVLQVGMGGVSPLYHGSCCWLLRLIPYKRASLLIGQRQHLISVRGPGIGWRGGRKLDWVACGSQSLRAKVTLLSVLPEAWPWQGHPLSGPGYKGLKGNFCCKQKNVNSWDVPVCQRSLPLQVSEWTLFSRRWNKGCGLCFEAAHLKNQSIFRAAG